jgi:predicted HAD superfamily phosphohydrolase YqeG
MLSNSEENLFLEIDLSSIKGILVDIDNTLYSYEPAHKNALKACFRTFSEENIEKPLSSCSCSKKQFNVKDVCKRS